LEASLLAANRQPRASPGDSTDQGEQWAVKDVPARLDVVTTARVLGFAEHDLQVLMSFG